MALSSNEHELLVSTCENMNVAAGTCREVLEMLRNLGNTGVVDIATHNNSQGAHANDKTLAHGYDTGYERAVVVGPATFSGYNFTTKMSNYPITLISDNGSNSVNNTKILMYTKTLNRGIGPHIYIRGDGLLTDANGQRVAFGDYTQSQVYDQSIFMLSSYLHDAEENYLTSKIVYYIGRHWSRGDTQDVTASPYTKIVFVVSSSFATEAFPITIDMLGLVPGSTNSVDLGSAGSVFKDLYLHNAATITSDRREKRGISALGGEAVEFIKALRPVRFKLAEGVGAVQQCNTEDDSPAEPIPAEAGSRNHWGLIAQEVHEALVSAGYDPSDCAVWSLADKNDPDSRQALRYEELIAPMIKVIQQQQERIEALERKVA